MKKKIRYAVVGLGWIAQDVVLPAFANARNSELTALVSDDPVKLKELGKKYRVSGLYTYDAFGQCLRSGTVDAVYIALPNSMHGAYTVRAAKAGVHVLCEKPMAMTEKECITMREAAARYRIKLMIAYRLHFEEGNLKAIQLARSGKLGDVRIFNSTFVQDVEKGNVRWDKHLSGGTLYDMGIYSINAARGIFRQEPTEVVALAVKGSKKQFNGMEETIHVILRFPGNKTAGMVCSFATAASSAYDIIGTQGTLRVDPAFHHKGKVTHVLKIGKRRKETVFGPRDQFAPELVYFSDSIIKNKAIEPSGLEGQADVRIIEAIYRSARTGKPVALSAFVKNKRPTMTQEIRRPSAPTPRLVHAKGPSST